LTGVPGLALIQFDEREKCNYQYVVCEVNEVAAGISRDLLLSVLQAENVVARRYFYPGCHRMEPYRSLYPDAGSRLPHSDMIARRVLVLPTGTAIGQDEVAAIAQVIRIAVAHGEDLARRVSAACAGIREQ